jgi:hypothetical protein
VGGVLVGAPGGSPMTCSVNSRQFIIGGDERQRLSGEYIAFALPNEARN